MVYLVGDNNLSEEVAGSLSSIIKLPSSLENIRVFSFFDSGNPMVKPKFYDSHDGFIIDVDAQMRPVNSQDPPIEINSASKETITNFVDVCQRRFPADEYIFIISGHGDGFLGRTLLRDENPGGNLSIKELKETFADIDTIIGKPLSILGFDSCLMNMLEIGYEFRRSAKILLTSQSNVPNAGWNYFDMLSELIKSGGRDDAETYAEKFVGLYIDFQDQYSLGGRAVELSANRLKVNAVDHAGNVAIKVHELGKVLVDQLELTKSDGKINDEKIVLYRREIMQLILEAHCECQTSMYEQAVDLKDFCNLFLQKCEDWERFLHLMGIQIPHKDESFSDKLFSRHTAIKNALRNVIKAVDSYVVLAGFCGAEKRFTTGMTVFFPWTYVSYFMSKPNYAKLSFISDFQTSDKSGSGWEDFLNYYLLQTVRPEIIGLNGSRSNPRYGDKGLDSDTYLQYFSKIKNFYWEHDRNPYKNQTEENQDETSEENLCIPEKE